MQFRVVMTEKRVSCVIDLKGNGGYSAVVNAEVAPWKSPFNCPRPHLNFLILSKLNELCLICAAKITFCAQLQGSVPNERFWIRKELTNEFLKYLF